MSRRARRNHAPAFKAKVALAAVKPTPAARAPYEFGCKVSIATPVTFPEGWTVRTPCQGAARHPFDGHTLGPVVADMEKLTGVEARRIHVVGYRGHNHPHRLRVWISRPGQPRQGFHPRRDQASCGCRARHRPRQGRAPHGPQLSLKAASATASTPSSPRPATNSACSCGGSQNSCMPSSGPSQNRPGSKDL